MLSTDPRADLRTWIEEEGAFTLDSINPSAQEEIARGHGEDGSSGVSMYADVRRGMPAYTFLTTTVACLCTEGDRRNLMEANGYSFESSVASLSPPPFLSAESYRDRIRFCLFCLRIAVPIDSIGGQASRYRSLPFLPFRGKSVSVPSREERIHRSGWGL